jgi:hypothetical protein
MTKVQLKKREATRRLFLEYLKTPSLRELARRSGIAYRTLAYRFQHHIHRDYADLVRRGIFVVIRPHLFSKSARIREQVSIWLVENLDLIIQNEAHSSRVVFSEKKLDRLTYSECGRIGDYRDNLLEVLAC